MRFAMVCGWRVVGDAAFLKGGLVGLDAALDVRVVDGRLAIEATGAGGGVAVEECPPHCVASRLGDGLARSDRTAISERAG